MTGRSKTAHPGIRGQRDVDAAGATACADCGGEHLVVDELGEPYRPEWYGDRFAALAKTAGLPVIRLHDARHTCGTLMHLRGCLLR